MNLVRLKSLPKYVMNLNTIEQIVFVLSSFRDDGGKTIKSPWVRKFAGEVGICAELGLITTRTEHHPFTNIDINKITLITNDNCEGEYIDYSMGMWNITPLGYNVLNEVIEKFEEIPFKSLTLCSNDTAHHKIDTEEYTPSNWL